MKNKKIQKLIVMILILLLLIFGFYFISSKQKDTDTSQSQSDVIQNDEGNAPLITKEEKVELISSETAQSLIQENDEDEAYITGAIYCEMYASFSGQYVEDGSDEVVENVAAILVKNNSDKYLELATLQYDVNGKKAIFVVTGLPAKQKAWVMAKDKVTVEKDATFTYVGSATTFRDETNVGTDKIKIESNGNAMTITNVSKETLHNVCIYYKVRHSDGNFFGGISYVVNFGTLKPNESNHKVAGHYNKDTSEIIRIGWTTSK